VEKEGSSSSGMDAEQRGVRCQRLLQIGGRAGAVWRKGNLRERECPESGTRQHGAKDAASNGPRSSGAGGGTIV
jgi:hypothetical protein